MNNSIQASIDELEAINTELGRLREQSRVLKDRKETLEDSVIQFLNERDQPGIKYRGQAIIMKNALRRKRKKKQEKHQDLSEVLRNYGVSDVNRALEDILEAQRGTTHNQACLKFFKDK